jgi:branched-chain amino acid transport system ATP-binding protein
MAALLELENVEARYGAVRALHGVSLSVGEGEVVAVLGGNGAGKTTTLRAVSGLVSTAGEVRFAGARITGAPPERVARAGIAHVPEGRGLFRELSVYENLRLGAYLQRDGFDEGYARVRARFSWLEARRNQQAGTLSGGEQQMLAIARALMARPRLLLLDEPSLGLAPLIVREIFAILDELNEKEGLAVLVVEQNAMLALRSSSRAYVLEAGRVALQGASAELAEDESMRKAYLGY